MNNSPQIRVAEIQDYICIAAYLEFYVPGSLKLNVAFYVDCLRQVKDVRPASDEVPLGDTRRWMMRGEAPYPGYCRAPGSAKCVPSLCNCKKLKEVWWNFKHPNKLKPLKSKVTKNPANNTSDGGAPVLNGSLSGTLSYENFTTTTTTTTVKEITSTKFRI